MTESNKMMNSKQFEMLDSNQTRNHFKSFKFLPDINKV